jgi:hypothetical protein
MQDGREEEGRESSSISMGYREIIFFKKNIKQGEEGGKGELT